MGDKVGEMMDRTNEFILQCEKAIEIQKLWEKEDGDFFFTDKVYTWGCYECKRGVWLPRQDQLQEMLRSKYDIRTMCWDFNGFIGGRRAGYSMKFNSMEQLWLAFVMQVKFGKIWNGKEWEQWTQKVI